MNLPFLNCSLTSACTGLLHGCNVSRVVAYITVFNGGDRDDTVSTPFCCALSKDFGDCRKMVLSSEKWTSAFRIVADELGFLENTDETAYKLCSGLKWLAKVSMCSPKHAF